MIKPLNEYKQYEMDKTTSNLFCLLIQPNLRLETEQHIQQDVSDQFLFKVMEKRAAFMQLNINWRVIVFLSIAVCNSPADSSLYLHAIHAYMKERNIEQFTMNDLAYMFPNGFPDQAELSKAWAAQKDAKGDNLVDAFSQYGLTV